MDEIDINQQLADEICAGAALNGEPFRIGECVALLDGKVVAVAKSLDDALCALRALEPNPLRGMVVEVGRPVIDVIR